MENWKTSRLKKLAKAFLSMKTESAMLNFLRDLCTQEELVEFGWRWEAAKMLNDGLSYRAVASKTSLSTTTVTRIAHWLHHGVGGYRLVLGKTKKKP